MTIENLNLTGSRAAVNAIASKSGAVWLNIETGVIEVATHYGCGNYEDHDDCYPWYLLITDDSYYPHDGEGMSATRKLRYSITDAIRIGRKIKAQYDGGARHKYPMTEPESLDDFWRQALFARY